VGRPGPNRENHERFTDRDAGRDFRLRAQLIITPAATQPRGSIADAFGTAVRDEHSTDPSFTEI